LHHEPSRSPAPYNKANGDYLAAFTSPSGKQVTVVVKSPVISTEYDAPPISPSEPAGHYLNKALYDLHGALRTHTLIKYPKGTYQLTWPVHSNCDQSYNWLLPSGLTDVVIDGRGSNIAFSGLCNGVGLWNASRVVLKNFNFSWPDVKLSAVGSVTATSAATFKLHIDLPASGPLPRWIASAFAWDKAGNHVDLIRWRDSTFYGDGVTESANSAPFRCTETASEQRAAGCTLTLESQGAPFTVGQSVILHFYNYGSAFVISGQDLTFDNLALRNAIGTGYALWGGRGLRVTHATLTRLPGE
jgi:hypothetical protein